MIARSLCKRLLSLHSHVTSRPALHLIPSKQLSQHCGNISTFISGNDPSGNLVPFLKPIYPLFKPNTPNTIGNGPSPSRIRINITVPQVHRITPVYETPATPSSDRFIEDPLTKEEISDKISPNQVEKQAARLVVIRRIKMNKHKLKKLRKRMKYVWAKMKLRREIRKEKAYLNFEMSKIREAQKFDAKTYVADILRRAKAEPIPKRWNGKWFPEPMIREKIVIEEKRKNQDYLSILDKRLPNKE